MQFNENQNILDVQSATIVLHLLHVLLTLSQGEKTFPFLTIKLIVKTQMVHVYFGYHQISRFIRQHHYVVTYYYQECETTSGAMLKQAVVHSYCKTCILTFTYVLSKWTYIRTFKLYYQPQFCHSQLVHSSYSCTCISVTSILDLNLFCLPDFISRYYNLHLFIWIT